MNDDRDVLRAAYVQRRMWMIQNGGGGDGGTPLQSPPRRVAVEPQSPPRQLHPITVCPVSFELARLGARLTSARAFESRRTFRFSQHENLRGLIPDRYISFVQKRANGKAFRLWALAYHFATSRWCYIGTLAPDGQFYESLPVEFSTAGVGRVRVPDDATVQIEVLMADGSIRRATRTEWLQGYPGVEVSELWDLVSRLSGPTVFPAWVQSVRCTYQGPVRLRGPSRGGVVTV